MFFSRFKVTGHSMQPLFNPGDKVIVNRLSYIFSSPKAGDIVAIRAEGQRGKILLKKINKTLSNNKYLVVGSNKSDSYDSDRFGPIQKNQILGKVLTKY